MAKKAEELLTKTRQAKLKMQETVDEKMKEACAEAEKIGVTLNNLSSRFEQIDEKVSEEQWATMHTVDKRNILQDEIEDDMQWATAELAEGRSGIEKLTPACIADIKQMQNPAPSVKLVISAVCALKGLRPEKTKDSASGKLMDDYWPCLQKWGDDAKFLKWMQSFDNADLSPLIIKRISDFTSQGEFQPDLVQESSETVYTLCLWIRSLESYYNAANTVAPKKQRLEKLAAASAHIPEKQAVLKEASDGVHKVTEEYRQLEEEEANMVSLLASCAPERESVSEIQEQHKTLEELSKDLDNFNKKRCVLKQELQKFGTSLTSIQKKLQELDRQAEKAAQGLDPQDRIDTHQKGGSTQRFRKTHTAPQKAPNPKQVTRSKTDARLGAK
eukprot:gnl/MRDRNA2_/MRDRNA2_31443_c0_seq1.p1 gnl/MRDRNA2_/MRDRNA2_31443_c0~~gnl/MRDRNA2_/MRDRNA2_31443_c0_seq1.p1  ORF type:complete len:401 (-),score=111.20 gnl/MRDRNA2_/MRDRNA2_31443_c0_seq1:44-1204(-)